jgi:hypothetical protein
MVELLCSVTSTWYWHGDELPATAKDRIAFRWGHTFFSQIHRKIVYFYIKKKREQEPLKNTHTWNALP